MENMEAAIAAIRTCKTRESLDQMLERFDITDPQKTIIYLNKSMYDPETFFSCESIAVDDKLEFTKQVFLTGSWKLNEHYERMGIGEKAGANA